MYQQHHKDVPDGMIIALPPQLSRVDNLKVGRPHSPKRPAYSTRHCGGPIEPRGPTLRGVRVLARRSRPDISGWGQESAAQVAPTRPSVPIESGWVVRVDSSICVPLSVVGRLASVRRSRRSPPEELELDVVGVAECQHRVCCVVELLDARMLDAHRIQPSRPFEEVGLVGNQEL